MPRKQIKIQPSNQNRPSMTASKRKKVEKKSSDLIRVVQKHKPFKLQDVLDARGIINDAYERANSIENDHDKLTVLKTGYNMAIELVPNVTKPKKQWHIFDVEKYQYELQDKRVQNLYKAQPNQKVDAILKKRQNDCINFQNYSLKNGIAYVDDLILLDENFNSLTGISVYDFVQYIEPYRVFLQQEFLRLNQKNQDTLFNNYKSK